MDRLASISASSDVTANRNALSFGRWLMMLRKSRRLSRQAVASRAQQAGLGLSQQYLHFIETEKATNIGTDKIRALSAGLGVPLAVLEQAVFHRGGPEFFLRGRVSAGSATSGNGDEYGEGVPYFDASQVDADRLTLYYVEIMGDSMAPKIEHGDLALIKPLLIKTPADNSNLENTNKEDSEGDLGLGDFALIESGRIYLVQEAKRKHHTCKYLVSDTTEPETFWLIAENEALFPRTKLSPDFKVLGEVIEVRKSLSLYRPALSP